MKIEKPYRFIKNAWHYFDNYGIYVDNDGLISEALKINRNGDFVAAAVYKAVKNGGYDNIMPCTITEFKNHGTIL